MAGKSFIKEGQAGIGTQTTAERTAGVSTAAGTVTFDVDKGVAFVYTGDTDGWEVVGEQVGAISATGGTKFDAPNGKQGHVWTGSGSLVVESGNGNVEYIIIGGGGGGGTADGGGGGGGGGVRTNIPGIYPAPLTGNAMPITPGTYPVTRGDGGAKGPDNDNPGSQGADGGDSTFNSQTGGGGGGGGQSMPASPQVGRNGRPFGGSGGGGGASPPSGNPSGGSAADSAGGDGGGGAGSSRSPGADWTGGGGGGAGPNAGNPGQPTTKPGTGDGAAGIAFPTAYVPPSYGTPGPSPGRWFGGGGGGGGGDGQNEPYQPQGGAGGGGNGERGVPLAVAEDGDTNTGGGGGGKDLHNNATPDAGNGGPGIIFVFYDK